MSGNTPVPVEQDDVVERLDRLTLNGPVFSTAQRAAAEILRLRSQVEAMKGVVEALRQIADHNNAFLTDGSEPTRTCIDWCVKTAKDALSALEQAQREGGA